MSDLPTATGAGGIGVQATPVVVLGEAYAASGVTPVTGSFTATGQSGNFPPKAGRPFNVSVRGTFVGTVQLERSFDGTNWFVASRDSAGTAAAWTAPMSVVVEEPEAGVLYRLNCTAYTSGTITYRMSQ